MKTWKEMRDEGYKGYIYTTCSWGCIVHWFDGGSEEILVGDYWSFGEMYDALERSGVYVPEEES